MIPAELVSLVDQTASAVGSAIEADLERAAAPSAMGGKFEVDLEVLYGYYGKLTRLYDEIDTHLDNLKATSSTADLQCGGAGSRIVGAARAAEVTGVAAGSLGMQGALLAIQQRIAAHLASLKANYDAYVNADDNGARVLTAAAHPELTGTAVTPGNDDRPSGW